MSSPIPIAEPQAQKHPKRPHRRQKPTEKPLSPKHRRLLKAYTDPNSPTYNNATQSALKAGYSPTSAHDAGSRILKRDDTGRELTRIYEAAGVTTQKLAQRVKQGLNAHYDQAFIHQKTGLIVYAKRRPDYNVRLKAVRLASEIRGDMAPKEVDVRVAVLAGRIQAARRREIDQAPQPVVVGPDDKEAEPVTPTE